MTAIKIGIIVGGFLSLVIVAFKTQFYRYFRWKIDFEKITPLNHRVLYTIHIALYLLVAVFAFISLAYAEDLSRGEGLAAGITLCYSLFWLWRLVWQLVYFKSLIREADGSNIFLHYSLIVIFAVLFIVYLAPTASKLLRR